jgi:hypothetical protein
MNMLRLFAVGLVWALALVAPAMAQAPGRGDPFAVAGTRVDVTAADAATARTQGFAQAQRVAFDRLVKRLVTSEELTRLTPPRVEGAALDRLVRGVDVEDERRSGTRYIARLGVVFDPAQVRTLLRNGGFTVLETRAPPQLIVAVVASAQTPAAHDPWRQAFEQGGFANELQPIAIAPAALVGAPGWTEAQNAAAAAASATAIYATARLTSATTLVADLVEVGPDDLRRTRGQASASVQGGVAGLPDAYRRLAIAVNDKLQADWKTRLASGGGQRQRMAASALYADMEEWSRLKMGLESAARTLISEIRIEAIAKDGALVSFAYVGDSQQLASELQRLGLSLEQPASGPVLRVQRR